MIVGMKVTHILIDSVKKNPTTNPLVINCEGGNKLWKSVNLSISLSTAHFLCVSVFVFVFVCHSLPHSSLSLTLRDTHSLSLSLLEGIEVRKKIVDLHFSKEFLSQSSSEDALAHYWVPRRSLLSEGAEEMVHLRDLPMLLPIDCQF